MTFGITGGGARDSPPPLPGRCGRPHPLAARDQTGWHIRGTAGTTAFLGRKPTTLEFRIKKLGLSRPH